MEAILFCGIQATGKTTFYTHRFVNSHLRISLDLLHTRNREQAFLETCLATQQPFVVDNTNLTRELRERYITLAKGAKYRLILYYFQSKITEALDRNAQREGKARIPDLGIKGAYNRLELPTREEGYDRMFYVRITENGFQEEEWQNEV